MHEVKASGVNVVRAPSRGKRRHCQSVEWLPLLYVTVYKVREKSALKTSTHTNPREYAHKDNGLKYEWILDIRNGSQNAVVNHCTAQ